MLSIGVDSIECGSTLTVFGARDVHTRVVGEETGRLEEDAKVFHRHDWPVFRAGNMGRSERKEENDVLVLNAAVTLIHPLSDGIFGPFSSLWDVFAAREQS